MSIFQEEPDSQAESEVEEVPEEEVSEQVTMPKSLEANRRSIEEMVELDGIERVVSQLKRFRAADVKELIRDEYPDMDLKGVSAMDMTKKELLDCLSDFYKNDKEEV